ncbi:MAG: HAD-IIB family hydrolase [Erysipelotrichaceae bacterium]|nr:HAD-IIB family hydrolase [Erysipelotrichaceae bacterium]
MIEKISVMAADIDGTLCMKGSIPGERTLNAIRHLHDEGVLFGVASGRPMDRRILDLANTWNLGFPFDFAIGMNGGDLYNRDTDQIEHYYQLKKEDVREILSLIHDMDLNAIVYVNGYDEINALRMDDFLRDSQKRNHSIVEVGDVDFVSRHDTGKIECHLKPSLKPEFYARLAKHPTDRWITVQTFEIEDHTTIEFLDPHVNKGIALRQFSEKTGIPLSEFIAFGDMDNDYGLIKEAGYGVCLCNGCDEVKSIAQAITEYSVHEDGVGRWLEDHWFSR